MREQFIQAMFARECASLRRSTRGVIPEADRDEISESVEAGMAELERVAAESAWDAAVARVDGDGSYILWTLNPYRKGRKAGGSPCYYVV